MSSYEDAAEQIVVEFLKADATTLKYSDLGPQFLEENQIKYKNKPFKISIEKKKSKAGNAYYDYSQQSVPLPDGLSTLVRVENCIISLGEVTKSKKGHPTKRGIIEIMLNEVPHIVTTYITESEDPYFIKVISHKKPDNSKNLLRARKSPRGGSFVT